LSSTFGNRGDGRLPVTTFAGTIVIVTYNSSESLGPCLASIARFAPAARVVVVDNASNDDPGPAVALHASQVTLVRSATNRGFGGGVNLGLRQAAGEFVLLLNPDCVLHEGAAERMQGELREHPECALVGPQILNPDGSLQGSARGDPSFATGLFGRTTLLTRLFPNARWSRQNIKIDQSRIARGESFAVDWVSGACMMARRTALEAVGGFDERYFLYWEDADLCRRLRNTGQTVRYVPAAKVMHVGARSSDSNRALATRAFHDSAYTYYATHVATTRVGAWMAWGILKVRGRLKLLFP
jgi:N-acetylglucosaminyl-diphospho-decaprenol L-rhamnosyltransferase